MGCEERPNQHRGVGAVPERLAEHKPSDHGSAKGGDPEQSRWHGIPAKIAQADFESCKEHQKHPAHLAEEVAHWSYLSSQGYTVRPEQESGKNQTKHARQPK